MQIQEHIPQDNQDYIDDSEFTLEQKQDILSEMEWLRIKIEWYENKKDS